ncbi:MAG: DUF1598 domain-containing protein [Rubripirellula sp.]
MVAWGIIAPFILCSVSHAVEPEATSAASSPNTEFSEAVIGGSGGRSIDGAGGGSLADFDSLMTLIQNTVEPDTWEALGGVGTMAPYPAGVMVDPDGLLRELTSSKRTTAKPSPADRMAAWLEQPIDSGNSAWTDPAKVRCVSMRRMAQALAWAATHSEQMSNDQQLALDRMAGLSRVSLVLVTPDDFILAGPVAGFDAREQWMVDRKSGLPMLRLSSVAVGLSACRTKQGFGCTIDPDFERLKATTQLGMKISSGQIPIGDAKGHVAQTLGRQNITVFGTSSQHEVAWCMVEADRHMKRLALGEEPMPEGVRNYVQLIASTSKNGPPSELLLRLWFNSQPLDWRCHVEGQTKVIQIAGKPMKLSGENELALANGERGHRVLGNPTTEAFVDHFNQNLASIRRQYPVYGALESVYQATAISRIWTQLAVSSDHDLIQRAILHFASLRAEALATPREVDSIVTLHSYREGRQRHHVMLASGGVSISGSKLISDGMRDQMQRAAYPPLATYARIAETRPPERWWWNASMAQ